jgi:AAA15 family ATPase/GTPase
MTIEIAQSNANKPTKSSKSRGITGLTIRGYKSIAEERHIEIRPLTILAGTNSSGKSSMIQPLLLLKQTLEAIYDPGVFLLNGPNLHFNSVDDLLTIKKEEFEISIELNSEALLKTSYTKQRDKRGFKIEKMVFTDDKNHKSTLYPTMSSEEIIQDLIPNLPPVKQLFDTLSKQAQSRRATWEWRVKRNRCFIDLEWGQPENKDNTNFMLFSVSGAIVENIRNIIHLPGLRGNPERSYVVAGVGDTFSGTFENYVASILVQWQAEGNSKLDELNTNLKSLDLTTRVTTQSIDDAHIKLQVGRLRPSSKRGNSDLVDIADVGSGVSQVLPVLVALLAARPGQLVYLEEPEIHLHPYAQHKLAQMLADAAQRGVQVVVETHSNLVLRGVQTLVAKGELSPELVKLHGFKLSDESITQIDSVDVDENGAFGKWSADFSDAILKAEDEYLDAALKF